MNHKKNLFTRNGIVISKWAGSFFHNKKRLINACIEESKKKGIYGEDFKCKETNLTKFLKSSTYKKMPKDFQEFLKSVIENEYESQEDINQAINTLIYSFKIQAEENLEIKVSEANAKKNSKIGKEYKISISDRRTSVDLCNRFNADLTFVTVSDNERNEKIMVFFRKLITSFISLILALKFSRKFNAVYCIAKAIPENKSEEVLLLLVLAILALFAVIIYLFIEAVNLECKKYYAQKKKRYTFSIVNLMILILTMYFLLDFPRIETFLTVYLSTLILITIIPVKNIIEKVWSFLCKKIS